MTTGMNFTTFDDSEDTYAVPNKVRLRIAYRRVVKNLSDLSGLVTDKQAAAIFDLQVELERVVFGET